MERDTPLPVPCGAYDARFISDLLTWLRAKAAPLNDEERNALLQRANQLHGLHGCFDLDADRTLRFNTPHP